MRRIPIEELIGKRFGRFVIIEEVEKQYLHKRSYRMFKVICQCGKIEIKPATLILSGHTKSCGCLNLDTLLQRFTIHNLSYTRIHRIWKGMKERCNNPKAKSYSNYGGRGIKVCGEWNNSFAKFYEDMIDGYSEDLTIDRIDNDGIYCKENCRWATYSQQQINKRRRVV